MYLLEDFSLVERLAVEVAFLEKILVDVLARPLILRIQFGPFVRFVVDLKNKCYSQNRRCLQK